MIVKRIDKVEFLLNQSPLQYLLYVRTRYFCWGWISNIFQLAWPNQPASPGYLQFSSWAKVTTVFVFVVSVCLYVILGWGTFSILLYAKCLISKPIPIHCRHLKTATVKVIFVQVRFDLATFCIFLIKSVGENSQWSETHNEMRNFFNNVFDPKTYLMCFLCFLWPVLLNWSQTRELTIKWDSQLSESHNDGRSHNDVRKVSQ